MSDPSCFVSDTVNVNRIMATRSSDAWEFMATTDTRCSLITRVSSINNPVRSKASSCNVAWNTDLPSDAHATDTNRCGSWRSFSALVQSVRCTDTPPPRVTNPKMESPGTGMQHLASFAMTSGLPSTRMPEPFSDACDFAVTSSLKGVRATRVSTASSASPNAAISRLATCWAEMPPAPIAV